MALLKAGKSGVRWEKRCRPRLAAGGAQRDAHSPGENRRGAALGPPEILRMDKPR